MLHLKQFIVAAIFILLATPGLPVDGTGEKDSQDNPAGPGTGYHLEAVVRGAVEDQSWMTCRSKEEVYSVLSRYYCGALLDDLARRCWDFIARPTDWYSVASVKEIRVLYDDGSKALVEAVIGIKDVDTGHNETGKAFFALSLTSLGWRVYYASYFWNNPPDQVNICYNVDAPEQMEDIDEDRYFY